jgi:hypothetical protein
MTVESLSTTSSKYVSIFDVSKSVFGFKVIYRKDARNSIWHMGSICSCRISLPSAHFRPLPPPVGKADTAQARPRKYCRRTGQAQTPMVFRYPGAARVHAPAVFWPRKYCRRTGQAQCRWYFVIPGAARVHAPVVFPGPGPRKYSHLVHVTAGALASPWTSGNLGIFSSHPLSLLPHFSLLPHSNPSLLTSQLISLLSYP